MAIRLPLQGVLDVRNNGLIGEASVAGGIANTFNIPQDTDNIVVKLTASVAGGGVSVVLQTTDDGGTTWFDVARSSVVSNTAGDANAEWLVGSTIAPGIRTPVNGFPANSILSTGIGSSPASALGQRAVSGLPVMSQLGRTFLIVGAAVTGVASVRTQVKVNSQSATA